MRRIAVLAKPAVNLVADLGMKRLTTSKYSMIKALRFCQNK